MTLGLRSTDRSWSAPFEEAWGAVAQRLFRHLQIDASWRRAARKSAARGPMVYVLRTASTLDLAALEHVTRKLDLPELGFVNDPDGALGRAGRSGGPEALRETIGGRRSAALFLRRRPQPGELRPRPEGLDLLETLIDLQRSFDGAPIVMLPTVFVWTRQPERRGFSVVDTLLGPVDSPTELRRLWQFLGNYTSCELRGGDALALDQLLAESDEDTPTLARRLGYALVRRVERERRTVVGPAHKPPDRVREEVLRSPRLRAVIAELAGPRPEDRAKLIARAREILREMQTIPEPQTQAALAVAAEQLLERVYAGIDVDEEGLATLRQLHADGSVVLLPSHKSHVDYIVLSYVLRERSIQVPVVAAGDNLSFFPAGPLLRRCGAFYIRRSFRGDKLYAAVLDAYVRRLMRDGWMLELFLEGTRSRTGKPLPPMLGLLNMVVGSALGLRSRKLYFVPVSIGYERSVEEDSFSRELSGGDKRPEDAGALIEAGGVLTERWGRINVQIGEPIDLDAMRAAQGLEGTLTPARRRALVKRLGHRAMSEVTRITAVTPGALVSLVLLSGGKGIAYADLVAQSERMLGLMLDLGARATPSIVEGGRLREAGVREILRLYVKSQLVVQHVPGDTITARKRRKLLHASAETIFTVPDHERLRLDFTKNHIVSWLVDRALIAVALLCLGAAEAEEHAVFERVQSLSRLFKYEFMFRADAPFEVIFEEVLSDMERRGEIERSAGTLRPGPGREGLDGAGWLSAYASTVRNFVESYRVAARGLAPLLKGPATRKALLTSALRRGERMFLEGEIERSEAVSRPMIENALASFLDQGYLTRDDGKLALAESFASPEGLSAVEGRIAAHLPPRT